MITNFEEITQELNRDEMSWIQPLINGFKKRHKGNPIKAPEIIKGMRKHGYRITEPRLRKCVNYIRTNGLLPLIATSKGYYVTHNTQEIKSQIESLYQRANSIARCADGLKKFV